MKKPVLPEVPFGIWLIALVLATWGWFTPNPFLTVLAAGVFLAFFVLLWKTGDPPVLLLLLGLQWLQVTTKLFNANFLGLKVSVLNEYGGDIDRAVFLGLASLLAMAVGMRFGQHGLTRPGASEIRAQIELFSVKRLWLLYVIAVPLGMIVVTVGWALPGMAQLGLAFAGLKWAAFFILVFTCLARKTHTRLVLAAMLVEVGLGLGGYFSDFKTVFFVAIIAFVAAGRKLTVRQALGVSALVSSLFVLSLIWTAVKTEYRDYVSDNSGAQVVAKGYGDRMNRLFELVGELTHEDISEAMQDFADRLSYVDYFGRVLLMVPSAHPHEDGALWGGAVEHILTPRLFFPSKPPLRNDSEITEEYTGLTIIGGKRDTSVSIGYVAESYIDFGGFYMFPALAMLGYIWMRMYVYLVSRKRYPIVFNYGLAVPVLLPALDFGTTNVKMLGGVMTVFLVTIVVQRFAVRPILQMVLNKRILSGQRSSNHGMAGY